jgi:tetratricopeptide repeat protein
VIDDLDHALGSDHPRTLNARGNLAGAYAEAKQTSQAIALQERAVADFERVLGSDHPDTIIGRATWQSSMIPPYAPTRPSPS